MLIIIFGAKIYFPKFKFIIKHQLISQSQFNMKAAQINPDNVSISLVYCLFGVLSFFVLKIATKYFTRHTKMQTTSAKEEKSLKKDDVVRLNFSKIFLKTYFQKSTLIGSIFNQDKKYLLKQIFVFSCIAVSCFNINSYIIWPWAVGLGVFVATFILSEIIAPIFFNENKENLILNQSETISNRASQIADSNSIQIEHTQLQLSISTKGQVNLSNNVKKQQKREISKKQIFDLLCITIMAIVGEILICQCILTLSLSVSNSGVLNLVSLGVSVLIDQFIVRVAIGLVSYAVSGILHQTQLVNLFQNEIFVSYCQESMAKEIQRVHKQRKIEEMAKKISNINHPHIINQQFEQIHEVLTEMKMIYPGLFEQVTDQIPVEKPEILQAEALLQEQQQIIEEDQQYPSYISVDEKDMLEQDPEPNQTQETITLKQEQTLKIVTIKPKDETNYFQLFAFDLEMFDDFKVQQTKPVQKKKLKKKKLQPIQKFKNDPYLYFPYQQHKLSHKNTIQQSLTQTQETIDFSRHQSSIQNHNQISSIDVIDFTYNTILSDEPQIELVLQERNLNIKTLVVNQKPQIPPTARPNYSVTKKQIPKEKPLMKKNNKVSPYLVPLSSQAIKPKKSKKIHVSKNNKENANQTNKSFSISEAISMSGMSQKEIHNFGETNIQNSIFNGR